MSSAISSALLTVPIHLDALYLHKSRYVTSAMADFTRLPYFDTGLNRDINPDTPYLSEMILSQPFQDRGLHLKAGIHLHWSLPDALTKAKENGIDFPAVPNRWLITRSKKDDSSSFIIERQWVIESDFLSQDTNSSSINYPQTPPPNTGRPFRYLGRKIPLQIWRPSTRGSNYLNKLTAIGYGEPTFAAFYPNCHSVFGFYDSDYDAGNVPHDLRYDIVGWYSEESNDEFHNALKNIGSKTWQNVIQENFAWTVNNDSISSSSPSPQRMVCYAQITFNNPLGNTNPNNPRLISADTGVSIGNSSTEALAAHLSSQVSGIPEKFASAQKLENLLEAIQFADSLEQQNLDIGPKLKEKRHSNTFQPISNGTLWTIRRKDDNSSSGANADIAQKREEVNLSKELALELDKLNQLQSDYDRTQQEIDDLRTQIFTDWYKYMLCVYPTEIGSDNYPDIDEVKYFIEKQDIIPLKALIRKSESLQRQRNGVKNDITNSLNTINENFTRKTAPAQLELQEIAQPRYYVPNEPIVLFTGNAATPSNRHGQDGRLNSQGFLECQIANLNKQDSFNSKDDINIVRNQIVSILAKQSSSNSIAINDWQHQPWNPIILQWEVEFFPTRDGNNLDSQSLNYQTNFIERNYALGDRKIELEAQSNRLSIQKSLSTYSGTTILSSATKPILSERIFLYLEKHLLSDYYRHRNISEDSQNEKHVRDNINNILTYCENNISHTDTKARLQTLALVYKHLLEHQNSNLSQSLGGFNDALLMHKLTLQTPIADPIGFEPYRTFTETKVSNAVGQNRIRAPKPLSGFHPIRAGALKLLRLRLIDNFGVFHDVNINNVTTTHELRFGDNPNWVGMSPRLSQPARINFRWLNAEKNIQETNTHPDTTPICGWLLPNNLEDSLAVYDSSGRALGSLYALPDPQNSDLAQWRPTPGQELGLTIANLPNSHLRKTITYIQEQGAGFVANFLTTIDTALKGIDPENYSQHINQSVLMGRPVAIVRANIDLQLLGLPAINEGWNVFRQDLHRSYRETSRFTKVKFPIRIGEYHQLNDGLVGYWLEGSEFQIKGSFYASQSNSQAYRNIVTHHSKPITVNRSIDDPPQYLTMLVDPRGIVHATSGILPTKAISIPSDHYRDALSKIELTFFSAPILGDVNQIDLTLPQEAGYLWSWLEYKDGWTETSTLQTIRKSVFIAAIGEGGDTLWQNLLDQKWLSSLDKETAMVIPAHKRKELSADLVEYKTQIEKVLNLPIVEPARLQAHFLSQPTVREGWLKLRQIPNI